MHLEEAPLPELQPAADVDAPEAQQEDAAPTGEQVEQEAAPPSDAAFEEGFAAVNASDAVPDPEPPKHFGKYTEAEMQALLEQAGEVGKMREREAKVFGTLGSLKQAIDQLRAQPQPQAAPRLNAQLKRLSAEFPEMAAMLQEDLSEALAGAPAPPSQDVERMLDERLDRSSRYYETKLLSVMHPDWRTLPAHPEFLQWKGTLAPDELQVVHDSWDAIAVGQTLEKFKAWRAQVHKTKLSRQSRLESAMTPKGTRQMAPSTTDEDAFVAGFKSVRGG